MRPSRRQLSLFVPDPMGAPIEAVRQVVDPVQRHLIPAHVTLCREEELGMIPEAELESRLDSPLLRPVTLRFGEPEAFHGHGILMRCVEGVEEFRAMRRIVLGTTDPAGQHPHMTLAHPRNPRAPGNSQEFAAPLKGLAPITFGTIHLIEQTADRPWEVLRVVTLPRHPARRRGDEMMRH